jgi:hypothetical protein
LLNTGGWNKFRRTWKSHNYEKTQQFAAPVGSVFSTANRCWHCDNAEAYPPLNEEFLYRFKLRIQFSGGPAYGSLISRD